MSVVDLQQQSLQDCLLVFCRPHNNLSGAQSDHHGQAKKQNKINQKLMFWISNHSGSAVYQLHIIYYILFIYLNIHCIEIKTI